MKRWQLSQYFDQQAIVRNGFFQWTMFPTAEIPNSLCYATQEMFLNVALANPNIVALITNEELAKLADESRSVVIVKDPQLEYYHLHNYLVSNEGMRVHDQHFIHANSKIADTAVIGSSVIIEENVTVSEGAIIGDCTIIGAGTYIGEGAMIGVKGMQNTRIDSIPFNVKYAGGVRLGRECEVLAGAVIQKPYQAFYTEIKDRSCISVRAVIGHGSQVGHDTMIAGSTQIAGNVKIGDHVWIGPSVTIADAIKVGDNAQVKIGSVVVENIEDNQIVSGNFAVPHRKQLRLYGRIKNGEL